MKLWTRKGNVHSTEHIILPLSFKPVLIVRTVGKKPKKLMKSWKDK